MRQTHQPAAFRVAGGQLGRHAVGFEHGEVERGSTRKLRQQPLDYLMPRIYTHRLNIRHNLINHHSETEQCLKISLMIEFGV